MNDPESSNVDKEALARRIMQQNRNQWRLPSHLTESTLSLF